MRGKAKELPPRQCYLGITPAYAGKSYGQLFLATTPRDHPRVCGEKLCFMPWLIRRLGSPPRMRGKGLQGHQARCRHGITPAYAGKSHWLFRGFLSERDHPRVCGEKKKACARFCMTTGSPPRMRGKVLVALLDLAEIGITPAYAGKRLKRSHRIGHFSCILCLFHSVLHRASASGGSRAGPCAPPCLPAQNAVPV